MNIRNLMPNFRSDHESEPAIDLLAEEQEKRRKRLERNHGPRPARALTNGQIRRMMERSQASQKRKANRRFRREWMANQRAVATLRGQLLVAGVIPFTGGTYADPDPAIVRVLVSRYGSVVKAEERYNTILNEAV